MAWVCMEQFALLYVVAAQKIIWTLHVAIHNRLIPKVSFLEFTIWLLHWGFPCMSIQVCSLSRLGQVVPKGLYPKNCSNPQENARHCPHGLQ